MEAKDVRLDLLLVDYLDEKEVLMIKLDKVSV